MSLKSKHKNSKEILNKKNFSKWWEIIKGKRNKYRKISNPILINSLNCGTKKSWITIAKKKNLSNNFFQGMQNNFSRQSKFSKLKFQTKWKNLLNVWIFEKSRNKWKNRKNMPRLIRFNNKSYKWKKSKKLCSKSNVK